MRLFGLIGLPLTHSFSKKYFAEKFAREAIAGCHYELFPLQSIDELPNLFVEQPNLEGINVTIPYKQQVIRFLDDASNLPGGIEACNCIRIRNGRLAGFNTDVIGFEKSFMPLVKPHHSKALVLGNGGATAAVTYTLRKNNIEYLIVSRERKPGSSLTYSDVSVDLVGEYKLLINTTPLGMYPAVETFPPLPYEGVSEDHVLYDLVYNPELTSFLQKGKERRAVVKNGMDMLVIQAEESWDIWNRD